MVCLNGTVFNCLGLDLGVIVFEGMIIVEIKISLQRDEVYWYLNDLCLPVYHNLVGTGGKN